ncbi:hypothetical protein OSB04_025637 [Centaurea solstitialis]|uniref:Reverse transcriptase Ty1/copia-type domain-containing protein n=1 Tax=Centaurea solstitialis TaxID=347529 RepID=A0AA38WBG9_9ASTR|nr:hypothetical protein OSB04_025637 [Centaurea solstitialis]
MTNSDKNETASRIHPAQTVSNIRNLILLTLDTQNDKKFNTTYGLNYSKLLLQPIVFFTDALSTVAAASFMQLDAIILSWIYGTISEDLLLTIVKSSSTAHEAWLRIKNLFQDNKSARAADLEQQFIHTKLDNFSSVPSYCQHLKMLFDQISDMDQQAFFVSPPDNNPELQSTALPNAFSAMTLQQPNDTWYMDTCTSSHMASKPGNLRTFLKSSNIPSVGDGFSIPVTGSGMSQLTPNLTLSNHKHNLGGSLQCYKARLVVNGKSQQVGVDYAETFSPLVKPATIQTLLNIALSHSWHIHQLDVKNVFLHGDLVDTVYVHQPPGFVDPSASKHIGFSSSKSDQSLFIYKHGGDIAFLLLYVDDIILIASSNQFLWNIMSCLSSEFAMTDLGHLSYFLGILVHHSKGIMFLSQRNAHDGESVSEPTLYRKLSGALQYLTFTCPDISYASSKRQPTLSRSSTESEYRGVANVVAETSWLRNLLLELHCPLRRATIVYCNNVSAVYLSSNPVQHQRTKHVEMDIHFVHEKVAIGQVRVLHVPSSSQYADIFTKGLPSSLFLDFRSNLTVRPSPVSTAGTQHMLLIDYSMWDVIENGPAERKAGEEGVVPPPRTDAERKARQIEMKALSTLLFAIPNEYQHQFMNCENAKVLWQALEKRFAGPKC